MLELSRFGLSQYEQAAYEALVHSGISTAHALSKTSAVPYGKIYPVLASLERKGFAKVYAGKPQRWMAVEPKVAIEAAVASRESELAALRKQAETTIKALGELAAQKPEEPLDKVRIIEGYHNYLNLSVALHRKAKAEWLSISELSLYKPHIDSYKAAVKRGLTVRMLTSRQEATKEKLEIWKNVGVQLRFTDFMPTKFSVIDHQQVTIRIASDKRYISLWIQNPSLAMSLSNYFNVLWTDAEQVRKA
ncbi:TrmB family transcriptional regulator [Candidatus Woesearchaeota archaeon]|nr:TrmB family transcriptional regulator [Candidatus Woesearchaeota archaeon]